MLCGRLGLTCHLATHWNLEGWTGLGQDLGMGGNGVTGTPRSLEGEEAGPEPGLRARALKDMGRRSSWRNQAPGASTRLSFQSSHESVLM